MGNYNSVSLPKRWEGFLGEEDRNEIKRIVYNARQRKKYHNHPEVKEYFIQKQERYRKNNREKILETQKKRRIALKMEVFPHYGKELKCVWCGENNILLLALDHVNNDGREHRKTLQWNKGGRAFYLLLKRQNFPQYPPLQILCGSCNTKKMHNDPKGSMLYQQ